MYYWNGNQFQNIEKIGLESVVFIDGEEQGNIKDCFEYLFLKHFIPFADEYLKTNRMKIFNSLADCKITLYLEKEISIPDLTVIFKDVEYDISRTKMIVLSSRNVNDLDLKFSQFQNKLVAESSFTENDKTILNIKTIFDPDTENIHFNMKKTDT